MGALKLLAEFSVALVDGQDCQWCTADKKTPHKQEYKYFNLLHDCVYEPSSATLFPHQGEDKSVKLAKWDSIA